MRTTSQGSAARAVRRRSSSGVRRMCGLIRSAAASISRRPTAPSREARRRRVGSASRLRPRQAHGLLGVGAPASSADRAGSGRHRQHRLAGAEGQRAAAARDPDSRRPDRQIPLDVSQERPTSGRYRSATSVGALLRAIRTASSTAGSSSCPRTDEARLGVDRRDGVGEAAAERRLASSGDGLIVHQQPAEPDVARHRATTTNLVDLAAVQVAARAALARRRDDLTLDDGTSRRLHRRAPPWSRNRGCLKYRGDVVQGGHPV